ncbi:AAA family ATPase [Actinomyces weissii]|uniref:AAA family ATPase n=1 Tax=Actinomyces weissii TaxID=675090 RepID=A0A7T7S2E2_9ACTO|nr:AAA family ATPase [Actinomyces weissii]QQM67921.1 AAA family ATPase [Actinomyces weissii]
MLTRFEVSGFKNLKDVVVELGPFTCIAGQNAVGKSNLFDAIALLSALSRHTFVEACSQVREVKGAPLSDVSVLLSPEVLEGRENLRLAAEMIVPESVVDEFGQEVKPSKTYLRYEVELNYVNVGGSGGIPTLRLAHETLEPLSKSSDRSQLLRACPKLLSAIKGRRGSSYISLEKGEEGQADVIKVPREERGRPRLIATDNTQRTVLSAMASAEYPTILAANVEMSSWRFMSLEPTAMRSPDNLMETRSIDATGAHIPATLYRRDVEDPEVGVYGELKNAVDKLVDIRSLKVVKDDVRQSLELRAQVGQAPELPARSLSDGTLRFLALAAMNYAGVYMGLVSMEEPENGIHPAKIGAMLALLRTLAEPQGGHLRQVIINTHSPYMVRAVHKSNKDDILVAQSWQRRDKDGKRSASTSFHPLPGTWRTRGQEPSGQGGRSQVPVSESRLFAFLKNPASSVEEADD